MIDSNPIYNLGQDNYVFDLQPYVNEAVEKINVAVDARIAYKVAVEMRKLGWICIPPGEGFDE